MTTEKQKWEKLPNHPTIGTADEHPKDMFDQIQDFIYDSPMKASTPHFELTKEQHKSLYKEKPDYIKFAGMFEEGDDRFQVWDILTVFGVVRCRIEGRISTISKSTLWTPLSVVKN